LDTTGSVVYTGEEICRRMQNLTTVVYLRASAEEEKLLIARYLSDPKPVLWGDHFERLPGESTLDAIAGCYPKLLTYRKQLYERYAHRIVPMDLMWNVKVDARGFLEYVETKARPAT
jgi:hypothetical protein